MLDFQAIIEERMALIDEGGLITDDGNLCKVCVDLFGLLIRKTKEGKW